MRSLILFLLVIISCHIWANKSDSLDEQLILKAIVDYTKEWDGRLEKQFSNEPFLEEIKTAQISFDLKLDNSLAKKVKGSIIRNDSLLEVNDYVFSYFDTIKKLKKFNGKRINISNDASKQDSCKIRLSYPIISIDKKSALVFLESYSGPVAGSTELFIIEKVNEVWEVKDRIIKRVW